MSRRLSILPAFLALALAGCGPQPATLGVVPASFSLGLGGPDPAAPLAPSRHGAMVPVETLATPAIAPSPATPPTSAPAAGGGASGASAPVAAPRPLDPATPRLRLADGREIAVADADAVALPPGLTGLVSLIVPGRVPATIELPEGGLPALHPLATANAPEPTGEAVLEGAVIPAAAGVRVSWHAPGRSVYVGGETDAEGRYRLVVPTDGDESGVVLAKDGQARVALAEAVLHAGASASAPALALAAPTAQAPAPALPAGWQWQGASLSAVPASATTPWRVPVWAQDGTAALGAYDVPGFGLVASYAAASPDERQGGLVCAAPGAVADWLAPIDPATLPAALTAGAPISWPAVPGAQLYTLRVTATGQASPVWEAASLGPTLTVPAGLALTQPGLTLELTAWDAPDVTIYSVAALRALRLPAGPQGLGGRLSWARRAIGEGAK